MNTQELMGVPIRMDKRANLITELMAAVLLLEEVVDIVTDKRLTGDTADISYRLHDVSDRLKIMASKVDQAVND